MNIGLEEIIAYIEVVPEFKPVVRKLIDALKAYEDEYNEISDFVIDRTVANKIRMYKAFQDAGISDDHALALTVNVYQQFEKTAKQFGENISANKADKIAK
jgi:hypothetical protein